MTSNYEDRVRLSQTRVTKAVFPNTTNHYETLFGGTAMQWMDEVAFITATRFTRMKVVTVSSDRLDFKKAIPEGSIVELVGNVTKLGRTSLEIQVQVFLEAMLDDSRELALEGSFTFVALGEDKKPVKIAI
ncbi:acyl-CoA thioesterase [Halobacteriovorax sp. HLS]|uniref:acyl-CoA thioesterase n=1 Tax=Halobacteriovorax sp. HLS TaxID=2234000 RepID=UPI000FD70D80